MSDSKNITLLKKKKKCQRSRPDVIGQKIKREMRGGQVDSN